MQITGPIVLSGGSSYFTAPKARLDPNLFSGSYVKEEVKNTILHDVTSFLSRYFVSPVSWIKVYLAGSSASYQWHDTSGRGDLDILVGVDFPAFRRSNSNWSPFPDEEIASRINDLFYNGLNGVWGNYYRTFYVNPKAYNIRAIHPYAAYNLTDDYWSVAPVELPPEWNPGTFFPQSWKDTVDKEIKQARSVISTYNSLSPFNPSPKLKEAIKSALDLYDDIHKGRTNAFSSSGQGFSDFYNYRWQAHKMAGTEQALRVIRDNYS
jgi:hypothetical protein